MTRIYLDNEGKWRVGPFTNPGQCGFRIIEGSNQVVIFSTTTEKHYFDGLFTDIQFKVAGSFVACTGEADFRAKAAEIDFFADALALTGADISTSLTEIVPGKVLDATVAKILDEKIDAVTSGYLGAIVHNATAPTPGKSGYYEFSSNGVVSWLSNTPTVIIGDKVAVDFTSPSTYAYTYISAEAARVANTVYLSENEYQVLIDNDLVLPDVQYNIYE